MASFVFLRHPLNTFYIALYSALGSCLRFPDIIPNDCKKCYYKKLNGTRTVYLCRFFYWKMKTNKLKNKIKIFREKVALNNQYQTSPKK